MDRRILTVPLFLIILYVLVVIVKAVVLGDARVVSLSPAPALSATVSENIATSSSNKSLPVDNKNYVLSNEHYFYNRTWVVATVTTSDPTPNNATIVLQEVDGTYQVILGPGTAFAITDLQSLPSDVSSYLSNSGVFIYTQDD